MVYPFPFAPHGERPSVPVDRRISAASPARVLGAIHRARRGRRLAVVDTHFPWAISGFRYEEARQMYADRPDTLFFSLHALTDPFPAPVHPLESFPRVAARAGVTDVYLVFLNVAVAFLGLADVAADVRGVPSFSLRRVAESLGLNVHVQLYPGGGLAPTTPPALLERVAGRCTTVFTNVAEVERAVPQATFVPMLVGAAAYPFRERDPHDELRIVFVGDDKSRKGLATLIEAFNGLHKGFRLDVVGPNDRHLPALTNPHYQAHGWLGPKDLRRLYERRDVFVSPSTVETENEFELGVIDGFPTTAAAEAMASGCALVASNPRREFRGLTPGSDYIDVPERDPVALADVLISLRNDRRRLAAFAARGAARVRAFATEIVVPGKLDAMGLLEPRRRGGLLPERTRARVEALLARLPRDTGGGSSLEKAFTVGDLIVAHGVRSLVEVGVYRGRFLLPAAVILRDLGRGPAIGIDPYSAREARQADLEGVHPDPELVERWTSSLDWDGVYDDVVRAISDEQLQATCMIVRRPSRSAAGVLTDRGVDLVHIDGNHDRRHVEEDLDLYLPKLRPGGILVMDDVGWSSVSEAIDAREDQLELLDRRQQAGVDDFAVYRVRSV
jgi:glycosyltransferase involved in cell wall biosynthesis